MTVTREEFTQWQRRTEARLATLEDVSDKHVDKINNQRGSLDAIHADLGEMRGYFVRQQGMLQALHLTQSEHTAALREHTNVLREHTDSLAELRMGVAETRVGIRTIIGLLAPTGNDEESGGDSTNQSAAHR
jgi:hypothetical protein